MKILRASRIRVGLLSALTVAVTVGAALGVAAPAQAALSGSDWIAQSLAARYSFESLSPVSCVPGQQFCLVIAGDSRVNDGFNVGQAALVSTNGGKSWKGYATLPSTFQVLAVSCVSSSVCWAAGATWANGSAAVGETTDGGKTWTDMTPASWAAATWWPTAIDCVSSTTCWLAGINEPPPGYPYNPAVASTTDGGANWTVYSNLPTGTSSGSEGTYSLGGISCVSALSCVAVGGLNYGGGTAAVISTTDGGNTWSLSTDPALTGLEELFSVSCLPPASAAGSPTCFAAGTVSDAAGPAVVVSHDGGATWGGLQTFDNTGWLNSISCVNAEHCWAAGAGTSVALVGTNTGGSSWLPVTSDTTNEDGSVSCLNVNVCVATTDNGLWVTSDGGGLR